MLRAAFLVVAAIFATTTRAASAGSAPPFQITGTVIEKVLSGNVTIQFTIYDPDPLTNATQVCTGSWVTGSKGFPKGSYEPCGNSSFAWNMDSFNSVKSFVLGLEHVYEDPAVGAPPYDYITNFGKANVTQEVAACTNENKTTTCKQIQNTIIKAPIYATIAKRKRSFSA